MVTPVADSTGYGPNREMSVFGYMIAAVIALALLPLLPIVAVVWVLWRLLRFVGGTEDEEVEPRSWPTNRPPRSA